MEKKNNLLACTPARKNKRVKKVQHPNVIMSQNNSPEILQLIASKMKNRSTRQHTAQLQLIKESIIQASLSGALSPKIATYLIKKTNLAGI